MVYLALTFWLLVVVWTAWGVHQLWSGMIKAKVLNTLLLPGTLVAQLGHVLGLLVTGATVSNTTLYKDDESGDPETTTDPKPRVPVIGPVVIGMLPLVACGVGIYCVARWLGDPIFTNLTTQTVRADLPTTMTGLWQMLRDQITLVESIVVATTAADFGTWRTGLFLYLLICLTVRIAPFPGNLRGSLAAIVILGIGAAMIASLFDMADPLVVQGWADLNLTVSTLLFLLLMSLVLRGGVGLVQVIRNES